MTSNEAKREINNKTNNETNNHITLIGMPASGKSTIGVMAAKFLGCDFIDTDILIQQQTGHTLPELIREYGQEGFLDLEGKVIASVHPERRTIIATGGSAVYRQAAMEHVKSIGTVIYLQVSCKQLKKRLHALEERGVVIPDGMTFEDLYRERTALYETYADLTIEEGDDSPYTIIHKMEALLH